MDTDNITMILRVLVIIDVTDTIVSVIPSGVRPQERTLAAETELESRRSVEGELRGSLAEAESRAMQLSIKAEEMERELGEARVAVAGAQDARSLALDLQREKGRLEGKGS